MSDGVMLPITDQVPFHAFQKRGFEAAMLLATDANGMEFFYNTCINCVLRHREGKKLFDFTHEYTPWSLLKDVFYTHLHEFDSHNVSADSIISSAKNYLDQGVYVSGHFNEKFIPHKNSYQRRDFEHTFFIYGYSNSEQRFYAIGYTDNRRFEFYTIDFSDFAKGFLGLNKCRLYLYYRNHNQPISLDLEALLNELEDYIRSDYTVNNELWKHPGYYYGVQAMKAFWSNIRMLVYRGRNLDVRHSRFFFEHKELMQKRLVFLHEKGYIKDYSKEYSTVVEKAKTIHLMFLKYNYTRRQEIVESIIQKLNEVNQLDEEVLLNVYYELKTQITIEKKTRYQNG